MVLKKKLLIIQPGTRASNLNEKYVFMKESWAVQRLIVILLMVDKRAQEVAKKLGIKVYSYTDEVEFV